MLHNCYITVYVPDYVTVIRVLGSGTNEGLSPLSGCGRPPSLVPTNTIINCTLNQFLKCQRSTLLRDLQITVQCHLDLLGLSKSAVQENHSVYLLKFWMSKRKILSAGQVLLNQSAGKPEQVVCCDKIFQKGKDIQKQMNRLRNILIIGFYNIIRLYSLQLPMIALKCLLMVTLKHS